MVSPVSKSDQKDLEDSGFVVDLNDCEDVSMSPVGLLDLSDDVLLYILRYCSPRDLKALGFSCSRLGRLVRERSLWRHVDARSERCSRARLKWLLDNALHKDTLVLMLTGYARDADGCMGLVDSTRKEAEKEMKASRESPCGVAGLATTHICEAFPIPANILPERLERHPARLFISAQHTQLPRQRRFPSWPEDSEVGRAGPQSCSGPQFTLSQGLLRQLSAECPRLTTLGLEYCNIDCSSTCLGTFPRTLKTLSLRGTKCYNMTVDKSFLFKIQDYLPTLESLDVSECEWMDPASLLPLSKMAALQELIMRDCHKLAEFVAYASLTARYGFRALKSLDLRGSPVGDSEVSALGWLPRLERLWLSARRTRRARAHAHYTDDERATHAQLHDWETQEPDYFKQKSNPDTNLEDMEIGMGDHVPTSGITGDTSDSAVGRSQTEERKSDTARDSNNDTRGTKRKHDNNSQDDPDSGEPSSRQRRTGPKRSPQSFMRSELQRNLRRYVNYIIDRNRREDGNNQNNGDDNQNNGNANQNNGIANQSNGNTNQDNDNANRDNGKGNQDNGKFNQDNGNGDQNNAAEANANQNNEEENNSHGEFDLGNGVINVEFDFNVVNVGDARNGDQNDGDRNQNDDNRNQNDDNRNQNNGNRKRGNDNCNEDNGGNKRQRGQSQNGDRNNECIVEMDIDNPHRHNEVIVISGSRRPGLNDRQADRPSPEKRDRPGYFLFRRNVNLERDPEPANAPDSDESDDGKCLCNHVCVVNDRTCGDSVKRGDKSDKNGDKSGKDGDKSDKKGDKTDKKSDKSQGDEPKPGPSGDKVVNHGASTSGSAGRENGEGNYVTFRNRDRFRNTAENDRRDPLPPVQYQIEQRHHVLYIGVGAQLNTYRFPRNASEMFRHLNFAPSHVDASGLVTDFAMRRFGRADGEDVNIIHIGPEGPMLNDPTSRSRPDRSSLRFLSVTGYRNITDRSLVHLATAAPNLTFVDFSGTNVTENGAENFKSLRPDCDVVFSQFHEEQAEKREP